jgi:hypothetical protein
MAGELAGPADVPADGDAMANRHERPRGPRLQGAGVAV